MVRSGVLWDPYCLAYLSWEDIEALMMREKEPPWRRVYASRGGLLNLDSMSSQSFRRQFLFEKADFPVLVGAPKMLQYITRAQGIMTCLSKRLCDLQDIVSNEVHYHIEKNCGCLLSNMTTHSWLKHSDLEAMGEAVHRKGAPLSNCWAFIDGTARPICWPSQDRRLYFSGHKRLHVLKYQSLMCPNGLICQLDGPYTGRRHDAGTLRDSQLYEKLEASALD
ncbi:hypothetical protein HPB52_002899 [Rhipicephalus sanguineus]|uniref:DDE Tnp4 domain-containing protein n=1 Tax=Rhipicephalus sanguineus TaxID=34632 RepID=A0A9D4SW52_RHISA|nr:hypothetical protein HPB52_002899 [Rhipicephalus sanguineus]